MKFYFRSMSKTEYSFHQLNEKLRIGTEWTDGKGGFGLDLLKEWVDQGDNLESGGISSGSQDVILSVESKDEKEFRLKTFADYFKRNEEYDQTPMIPLRHINISEIALDRLKILYDPRGMIGSPVTKFDPIGIMISLRRYSK